MGHRGEPPNREFNLKWKYGSNHTEWVTERRCKNCLTLVKAYIERNNLEPTKIKPPKGVGYVAGVPEVRENWAPIEEAVRLTKGVVTAPTIHPEILGTFEPKRDGLYAVQIGTHAFGMLHLAHRNSCWVADGLNSYNEDPVAQEYLSALCPGKNILMTSFRSQNRGNWCASSLAAILVEMQKAHKNNKIPLELKPERRFMQRATEALHPIDEPRITKWTPAHMQKHGISCPHCHKRWPHAKNRGILNLHSCPATRAI